MLANVYDKNCPSRNLLSVITGTWSALTISFLYHGKKRYSEIKKELLGVSEKMLCETLKKLELNGILIRSEDFSEKVKIVFYELTEFGRRISLLMNDLIKTVEWEINSSMQ